MLRLSSAVTAADVTVSNHRFGAGPAQCRDHGADRPSETAADLLIATAYGGVSKGHLTLGPAANASRRSRQQERFGIARVKGYAARLLAFVLVVLCPGLGQLDVCGASPPVVNGNFRVSNGDVLTPAGIPFRAKGINMYDSQLSCCLLNAMKLFSGLNFVRLATEKYPNPSELASYIAVLTRAGVVVEIEDHSPPCCVYNIPTEASLTIELKWYKSMASTFKENPYVWFGMMNEPQTPGGDIVAIPRQERMIYDTIRSTGNTSPIMLQAFGDWPLHTVTKFASYFSSMTNVIWEPHFYGWNTNYSASQVAVSTTLMAGISVLRSVQSADGVMPTIIGEYGPSTTGGGCDANYFQILYAVQQSNYGSVAWAYSAGSDSLVSGDGRSNFGDEVATWIRTGTSNSFETCP